MPTVHRHDPLDQIASQLLARAFVHEAPTDYRRGVEDALAAVRDAVLTARRDGSAAPRAPRRAAARAA